METLLFLQLGRDPEGERLNLDAWDMHDVDVLGEYKSMTAASRCKSIKLNLLQFLTDIDLKCDWGLGILAAHLYLQALLHVPVLVRLWYDDRSDRKMAGVLEKYVVLLSFVGSNEYATNMMTKRYTRQYFSGIVAESELDVRTNNDDDVNLVVALRQREIAVKYTVDDNYLGLRLVLPENFPLQPVDIEGMKRVGVSEGRWRSWILQLRTIVNNQGAGIQEALDILKRNIGLHFDGVEECTIWYVF